MKLPDLPYDDATAVLGASYRGDIISIFCKRAQTTPSQAAMACDDVEVTFEELWCNSVAVAKSLLEAGVERGDRVGVLLPTCVVAAYAFLGALMVGAIPLMVHARYRVSELLHVLQDAQIRVLITDTEHPVFPFRDRVSEAIGQPVRPERKLPLTVGTQSLFKRGAVRSLETVFSVQYDAKEWLLGNLEHVVLSDGPLEARSLREALSRRTELRSARDPALILYTSGTTGPAKGVLLSHEALVGNPLELGRSRFGLDEREVIWNPLPIFHIGGIATLTATIETGAKWVTMQHYVPGLAAEQLARHRPTVIYPTWQAITDSLFSELRQRQIAMPYLRVVLNAGHARLLRRWQGELTAFAPNAVQLSGWGLTETGGLCVVSRPADTPDIRAETVGIPLCGSEVAVVDPETRRFLEPGQSGELVIRGRALFNGYWRQPQHTIDAHLEGGWFLSGDQGAVDPDGHVRFIGRLRDVLKVGGENVSAAEIEAILLSHPAIAEAQIVGVPDARLGEVPAAYIKPMPTAEWNERELIAYCAEHLARFKVPRHIREIDEWPMSATKVRKMDLRRRLAEELGLNFGE